MQAVEAQENIRFLDALVAVFAGRRIARFCWSQGEFVTMFNEHLSILMADGKFHDWIITESDVEADDWLEVAKT